MSAGVYGQRVPRSATWPTAYLVVVGVLGGCGALFNALGCYVSIFALDSCAADRPAFRCTGRGLLTMWGLPWLGLAWAVGSALAVGARARRGLAWCGLPVGAAVYAAGPAGAWAVMTS